MRTGKNIYKRKDGRWEARYRKGRKDNGQIIYGSCYGKTYLEAKEKMENAKNGLVLTPSNAKRPLPTVGEVCDEWMQYSYLRLKQSTRVKYQSVINKHIKPCLGKLRIDALSTETIGKFGSDLMNISGLATKTVTDILVLVHSVLSYGTKHYPGIMTVVEVPYPKKISKEMRVLSKSEQEMLTRYLLADLNPCKFGIILAMWTGMRIGELCALQWKQISLDDQTIKIDTTMQRLHNCSSETISKTSIVTDSPKTCASSRIIPMGNRTVKLCQTIDPHNENAYILTGSEKYMEPRLLQYHFQRYICICGLEGVTFHTLRHTFATRCVEAGFEIKSLSEILGHANTAITLSRYVHCSLELKRENMRKLEAFCM